MDRRTFGHVLPRSAADKKLLPEEAFRQGF